MVDQCPSVPSCLGGMALTWCLSRASRVPPVGLSWLGYMVLFGHLPFPVVLPTPLPCTWPQGLLLQEPSLRQGPTPSPCRSEGDGEDVESRGDGVSPSGSLS